MKQILLRRFTGTSKIDTVIGISGHKEIYLFLIAFVLLVIFIFLKRKVRPNGRTIIDSTTAEILKNSKKIAPNIGDWMDDINKSRELYRQLIAKCHPDRFIDEEQSKRAERISQEITNSQRSYNRLLELKEVAQNELNITI